MNNREGSSKARRKDPDSDIQFKVIIVGDSGVGKSCLLARYIKGVFVEEHHVTLGAEFETKTIQLENKYRIKLQIWDTAGQQTFRSIVKTFYRNSAAVLLVYSLVSKKSFENLNGWLRQARENSPATSFFILVGTHSDLVDSRAVDKVEIEEFKRQNGIVLSFQTSAKQNLNVDIAFQEIAAQSFSSYMQRLETRRSSLLSPTKNISLTTPEATQVQKKSCC